jgi:hypothetical protein
MTTNGTGNDNVIRKVCHHAVMIAEHASVLTDLYTTVRLCTQLSLDNVGKTDIIVVRRQPTRKAKP